MRVTAIGRFTLFSFRYAGEISNEGICWNQIPGARGFAPPQSYSFEDHYQELQALGTGVIGLSVQTTEYQRNG